MKIALVVEDIDDLRQLAVKQLQAGGFEVVATSNGAEALDYLHSHRAPAVIVLDLTMPVMDGIEFLEHQLAEPELAGIPVVVYTSDPTSNPIMRAPNVARCVTKGHSRALVEAVMHATTSH